MSILNECIFPRLLWEIAYADSASTAEEKILLFSTQKNCFSKRLQTLQERLECYGYFKVLRIMDYSIFSPFPKENLKAVDEQTAKTNKQGSGSYEKMIFFDRYLGVDGRVVRTNFYARKLDDDDLKALIVEVRKADDPESSSPIRSKEYPSRLCIDRVVLATNIKNKLQQTIDKGELIDILDRYEYIISITESAKYSKSSSSDLPNYQGTTIKINTVETHKDSSYKIGVRYTLHEIFQLLNKQETLVYTSSEDKTEIIIAVYSDLLPLVSEKGISQYESVQSSQFFYFRKSKE